MDIILTTLNARYMHSAFGLRYLYANMGTLQSKTELIEFTIQERPMEIVEKLLRQKPKIIGFSVYIWNVSEIAETVLLIKQIDPDIKIIVGGPEVSHPPDLPSFVASVDYVITGYGEVSFPDLCEQILSDQNPEEQIIKGKELALNDLKLPYEFYTEEDIRNRLIYVEASRGCPFKCEFCLSSLDKTAKPFELDQFLLEMDLLHKRGARNFKFIDRTFNLKVSSSVKILTFFLERMSDDLYLHFEVIPDNLPEKLKQTIKLFPVNSLQFEIGVQTFDPKIQTLISRKQNNEKTAENLKWLRKNTGAHIHADLIFGLPLDTLNNFAKSFDQLVKLKPQEIQLGILKRLRGAPINRHSGEYQLRYNLHAPYNILSTREIDFETMQRVNRFARFWDMIANSGRFPETIKIILENDPFHRFIQVSDALYDSAESTWKISLKRLFNLLYTVLTETLDISTVLVRHSLEQDYLRSGQKGAPDFIKPKLESVVRSGTANKRQRNHL
ncbi:MAG: DUF4080 domain-containing protein [Gammaproteobacteria bacterium]